MKDTVLRSLSGTELREMFAAATSWLEKNIEQVNAINVFPVPDGDTGTNMYLTMRSSMDEARRWFERAAQGGNAGGEFGLAFMAVEEASGSPLLSGEARGRLARLRERVSVDAGRAHETLLAGLEDGGAGGGLRRVRDALGRYAGTPYEGDLRARVALLEARARDKPPTPAMSGSADPGTAPVDEAVAAGLLDLLARAEGLAGGRRFAESLPLFEEALAAAKEPERTHLEVRASRVRRIAAFVDAMIARITSEPARFRGLDLGGGTLADVAGATRDRIELAIGRRARIFWPWSRLTGERAATLILRCTFRGRDALAATEFLLEIRNPGGALRVLREQHGREPGLSQETDALVAEARGLPAIPEGGFHVVDDSLLTTAERDLALLRKRIAALAGRLRDAAPGDWSTAFTEIRSLGPEGDAAAATALQSRMRAKLDHLDEVTGLTGRDLAGLRQRLTEALEKARADALSLILDEKRYPYPYGADQAEVQAEVDRLVTRVASIWRTPSREILADAPGLREVYDDAARIGEALRALGTEAPDPAQLLAAVDARIAMPDHVPDDRTRDRIEHAKRVAAWNDQLEAIQPDERDCLRLTNEYRLMMGLRAVQGDDRLVVCARGHSQEMKDLGYFSHTSPTGGRQSPSQRARLAGWGGGVSENIAQGQADAASVLGSWCSSSGHHRNILGKGWTHLGVGKAQDGAVWTQNFGTGASEPPKGGSPRKRGGEGDGHRGDGDGRRNDGDGRRGDGGDGRRGDGDGDGRRR